MQNAKLQKFAKKLSVMTICKIGFLERKLSEKLSGMSNRKKLQI